jgi:HEAT repeat protein
MVSLKDKDKLVRCNVAFALRGLGNRTATDALIIALRDQDTEVREAAEKAFAELISLEELKKHLSEADVDRYIITNVPTLYRQNFVAEIHRFVGVEDR